MFTLKIIQARVVHGQYNKISFVNEGPMIAENTANVPYLSSLIHEKWGEGYVLVMSVGLRFEDSDGTRGLLSVYLIAYMGVAGCPTVQW